MRRVWISRGVLLPLVLLIAASFAFMERGSHDAQASAYAPRLTTTLSSSGAGATADINESANFGFSPTAGTRAFPATSTYFTPNGWGIPDCSPSTGCPYAFGEKTGTFTSTTTFGLLNSQCAIAIPVSFPNGMRNASTDRNDPGTLSPGAGFANLNADSNSNTVQDGAEHWNTLLAGLVSAGILPNADPTERQILSTSALGTPVWVDVLTYDPGVLGGPAAAPLGYATIFILENANPLNPPAPSLITDTCGLFNAFTQFGTASGGATHRSNPSPASGGGTALFALNSGSSRDADQGPSAPAEPTTYPLPGGLSGFGLVNNLDTCPFQPNVGSALAPAGAPFNGDSGESPGDGIDAVCDPNPTLFDGAGDANGIDPDGYLNRGDNCPLVANGPATTNQSDVGEFLSGPPVDGGPASDGIGDDCDLNPTVADGHFHNALNTFPVCIVGGPFADGDGDGWCDAEEFAIGGSTAGTPEALVVPNSCSDGVDNDLDGGTDLADTNCQLPQHDLSIKKLNGATAACNPSNTVDYVAILNNNQATDQNAEISIYLGSQPSYVPGPGPAPAPGKSAGSVTSVTGATVTAAGPLNIDGDADVEWLTKATVAVKGGGSSTVVHFDVTYPACGGGPNVTPVDYMVAVDMCHGNDIAPLGVSPLFGACAGGPSDGGQDANNGNDGVVTRSVDDISK